MPVKRVIDDAIDALMPAASAKAIQVIRQLDDQPERARRSRSAAAGGVEPGVERVQVHAEGRLGDDRRSASEDGDVQIEVADTGIGIAPEFLPFVFDRFRQADSSMSRRHNGLGLGMAIVRHLVELHGGTVTVESAGEGKGTTFRLKLPRHTGEAPSRDADAPDAAAARRSRRSTSSSS